ncbi:SAM-dependent methyltransferase [Collimonas sp. NPDC087041]|uniref:SAM-dependent methyltransferase n=1 Tax=Collimonas sp. NPDC087041 TaxID=3363960 RepID=UPI00380532E8
MTLASEDRFKFSTIAHTDHRYCSPLSAAKAEGLLRSLRLTPYALVLDAGCGKAALLRDLLALAPVRGVGVDINPSFLAEAKQEWLAQHPADTRLTLIDSPVEQYACPADGYDAILCIGSSHAFGGFDACLDTSMKWLKPGGLLLVGEGYWKQPASDAYLAVLGATRDELCGHAENAARGVARGFAMLRSATSNDDEWDDYEGTYCHAVMRYVASRPNDPDAEGFRKRIQDWHAAYLQWGRATLGFGYYLFEKPLVHPAA